MMLNWRPIFLVLTILMAACQVSAVEVNPQILTPEKTKYAPTSVKVTPSVAILTSKSKECVELREDNKLSGNGYLVLLDLLKSAGESFTGSGVILSADTLESTVVNHPNWYPDISPAGDAIAFLDTESSSKRLVVLTPNETYTFLNENFTYFYWVNDGIVAIKEDYKPGTYTLLLNPFSGETERIETNFPGLSDQVVELINSWAGRLPSFNSLLTHVIYPGQVGSNLLALRTGTIIRNIPLTPYYFDPAWSPLGDRFLMGFPVGENSDLASISLDNQVTMLTKLGSSYSSYAVGSYAWSPNGQRIGFWFSHGDYYGNDSEKSLAFIDLQNNELIVTCMSSYSFIFDATSEMVWSPDSQQVALRFYPTHGEPSITTIIDVTKLSYRIIPNNHEFTPKGWLTFRPNMNER